MGEVTAWNPTDDGNIDLFPENMSFAAVNDSGRAVQGAIARWFRDTNGSVVSSGSSNAYAITSNRTIASYVNNTLMWWRANFTNTGACTLNLNSLGIKDIVRATGSALTAGDITSGQIVGTYYNSSLDDFVLITPAVQGTASESATGLIELATAAEVKALDSSRAVRASVLDQHPAVPKFFAYATVSGGTPTLQKSYNVTSIADTGLGRLTVTLATDFASASWCAQLTLENASGDVGNGGIANAAIAAGSIEVQCRDNSSDTTFLDPASWHVSGLGDQI